MQINSQHIWYTVVNTWLLPFFQRGTKFNPSARNLPAVAATQPTVQAGGAQAQTPAGGQAAGASDILQV